MNFEAYGLGEVGHIVDQPLLPWSFLPWDSSGTTDATQGHSSPPFVVRPFAQKPTSLL